MLASWLYREEFADVPPLARLALPKHRFVARVPLTDEEQARLLDGAAKSSFPQRDTAVVSLLLTSGARAGELCSLTVADGQSPDMSAACEGKTGRRFLAWSAETARYIMRYLRTRPTARGDDPLLLTRTHRPFTPANAHEVVTDAAIRGQVGRVVTPHVCRHSFCTSVVRSTDLVSAQRLCGHKTLSMTARYCTPTDTELREAHGAAFNGHGNGRRANGGGAR